MSRPIIATFADIITATETHKYLEDIAEHLGYKNASGLQQRIEKMNELLASNPLTAGEVFPMPPRRKARESAQDILKAIVALRKRQEEQAKAAAEAEAAAEAIVLS